MTIHFAAAQSPIGSPVARVLNNATISGAANDNGRGYETTVPSDQMLRAALRHFAEHGLGAARAARIKAESAFFEGDRAAYEWWLGITRTLDRRLAAQAAKGDLSVDRLPEAANEHAPSNT